MCSADTVGDVMLGDISVLDKVYIVCGRKKDRIKAIYREKDGIVLLYKRLTGSGNYKWVCNQDEVKSLTWKQFEWLMDGLEIEQPKAIKPDNFLSGRDVGKP